MIFRSVFGPAVVALLSFVTCVAAFAEVTTAADHRNPNGYQEEYDTPTYDYRAGRGHLYVLSQPPGADIILNGESTGRKTPFLFENLAAGQYRIKVENGEVSVEDVKTVVPNTVTRAELKLQNESLMIETIPDGLKLLLDGQPIGHSPQFVPGIVPGPHKAVAEGEWVIKTVTSYGAYGQSNVKYMKSGGAYGHFFGKGVEVNVEAGRQNRYLLEFKRPGKFVEWFGMNLGGGYVANAWSYGRIDFTLFTINSAHWYYTVLEAGVFPIFGMAGVGGRFGYQIRVNGNSVFRAGLKFGFAYWMEAFEEDYDDYSFDYYGVEITPHIQFVRFYNHGSVGIGLDVPVLVSGFSNCSEDGDYCSDSEYGYENPVGAGAQIYFRWTVY